MTVDSLSAPADSSLFFGVAEAVDAPAAADAGRSSLAHHFLVEWLTLVASLVVIGMLIATALFKTHQSVDTAERDRLQVQSRVVDENIGQQLDGMNRALASLRDDFLAAPASGACGRAVAAAESAERGDPGRPFDGPARHRRHRGRLERRHAGRSRFQRPRILPRAEVGSQSRHALRRQALQDFARRLHDRLRARRVGAERQLRRRRGGRARTDLLRGADALGAVRAGHVGLARTQQRPGLRDDAARLDARRHRMAAGSVGESDRRRQPARRTDPGRRHRRHRRGPDDRAALAVAAGTAPGRAAGRRRQPLGRRRVPAMATAGARVFDLLHPAGGGSVRRPVPRPVAAQRIRAPAGRGLARAAAERRAARARAAGSRPRPLGLGPARRPLRAQRPDARAARLRPERHRQVRAATGAASPIRATWAGCSPRSRRTSAARPRSTSASSGSATSAATGSGC